MRVAGALALLVICGAARAADLPELPPPPTLPWSWTGFYFGGEIGGGFGSAHFPDPRGTSIFGGDIRIPTGLVGGQVGYNWQAPTTNWVFGVEAAAASLNGDWTNTCLASSGLFISANCRVRERQSGDFTGRVGFTTNFAGHSLLYAKAGAAWLREQIGVTSNGVDPSLTTSLDTIKWGWTAGAGAEKALTPAWSLRLEYDYANFGKTNVALPSSFLQVVPPFNAYVVTVGGATAVTQSTQTVKASLNLKLGESPYARWTPSADYQLRGTSSDFAEAQGNIEVGARTWYSVGRFQKDLGGSTDPAQQNFLVSRLTYATTAASGELFGRIDSNSRVFVKGFGGGGRILGGKMNDEDWVIFDASVPYSNTLSDPVKGNIAYATLDVGYDLFDGMSAKVGGFLGYNYFKDNKSAFGCTQIANLNSDCVPSLPASVLGITENDTWHSMRVGLNGVIHVTDRLVLTADAAYLPYVVFSGVDNHLLRTDVANTVSPESGRGQGVQLESVLSYALADSFSVGAGGRYWSMWATTNALTNIFSTPCPCQTLPARTEVFGGFLQASYKFNGLNF